MFEIAAAFLLDLLFGDPPYPWHPVRLMGRLIEKIETVFRFLIRQKGIAGFCEAFFIPTAVFCFVFFLNRAASQIHPLGGSLVSIYFIYSAMAVKDLQRHAEGVYRALRNREMEAARKSLSLIVGRDTGELDEEEVIRGTVETVAESFLDGILSPLFYAALGGAPLAMAYKAVNTLDSMVGNRSPRYREFGWAAAKIDEIINWIPARISWFLIGLAAFFVNGRAREAWHVGFEDGAGTSFPNGVVPEAAFAGALGVELGGTNFYEGEPVQTPKLGYPARALELEDIRLASRLMKASAWVALGFSLALSWLL